MGLLELLNSLLGRFFPSPTVALSSVSRNPLRLKEWDKGVFASELIKNSVFPRAVSPDDNGYISPAPGNVAPPLAEGTFSGSQKAATEMYHRIEQRSGNLRIMSLHWQM